MVGGELLVVGDGYGVIGSDVMVDVRVINVKLYVCRMV